MRAVKIELIKPDANGYLIELGNGSVFHFKNLKDAKSFESNTNRFFTELYFELNELYTPLYGKYRELWNYMDFRESKTIRLEIEIIEHFFDDIEIAGYWGISRIHRGLENIIQYIEKIAGMLLAKTLNKSHTHNIYLFNKYLRDCERLSSVMLNYAQDHPNIISHSIKYEEDNFEWVPDPDKPRRNMRVPIKKVKKKSWI